jgi:hypothetical protein
MNSRELRRLRVQLVLTLGLLAGCVGAAIFTAANRWWFEKWLVEKYAPLPAQLRAVADSAAQGNLNGEAFARLSNEQRILLYDDWMSRGESPLDIAPKALLSAAPDLYIARVERTLVCGSAEQRERGLAFLDSCPRAEALPMLEKARDWAVRRNLPELAERIGQSMRRIEQTAFSPPSSS